tara:strand:- start:293 stop:481 length:189 start_codon:yes stop_codon:yes gene_type:complete
MDTQGIVYSRKFGKLRKTMERKINNFVKKHMEKFHKPVTHVDRKKRDKIQKCRKKIKIEETT